MNHTIFVDTTTVTNNPGLDSAEWLRLLSLSRLELVHLIVPKIVLMEAGRQWQEHLNSQLEKLKGSQLEIRKSLQLLGIAPLDYEENEQLWGRDDYVRTMSRQLRRNGAAVVEVPEVPTRELIEQDLEAKKPFKRSGEGLRDAIIWESLRLTAAKSQQPIYFVSNNTRDYCNSKGFLHEDLLETLDSPEKVLHVKTLKNLFKLDSFSQFEPHLQVLDAGIDEDDIYELIENILADRVGRDVIELAGIDLESRGWGDSIAIHLDNPTYAYIEPDVHSLLWNVFQAPEPDKSVVSAEISAECEVEGFLFKGDSRLATLDDVRIVEADWNRHLMLMSESLTVRFRFVGQVELDHIEQLSLELDEAVPLDQMHIAH